jgi:hypothetical protein
MTLRTTRSSVTFAAPFALEGVEGELAAGRYDIETDEEAIEGNAKTVYRRVATLLIVRRPGLTRTWMIDPAALAAALAKDPG